MLTVSRMKAWRTCKRLHRLSYLEGWRSVRSADPLRQGTIGHRGLEAWWSADVDRLGAALAAIAGQGEDAYEQAAIEELLIAYDREWTAELARYEIVAVEISFTIPLVNPATGAISRTWILAGKIDGVLRERDTGCIVLLEHKLTSESFADDAESYWIKLGMDAQVSHYYLGAEGHGHIATGCLYDVLRRPRLEPLKATPVEQRKYTEKPSKLKDGTVRPAGSLYANQRDADETPDEYRARVRTSIAEAPAKYFARRTIARTDRDIAEYLGDVWAEARMMRDAELAEVSPKNPEACHRFGTCTYWPVCAYGVRPEDHPETFIQVENVHPELELQEA
jgi:hypothetical protein